MEIQSEAFCQCIGSISDKYIVSQESLIFSSNYTKCQIIVCLRDDLCYPFLSNFSETPCVKIGYDARIAFI